MKIGWLEAYDLQGIVVQVVRKSIKHLILRVYPPTGEVKLSAPLAVPWPDVEAYLWSKQAWIQAQRQRFALADASVCLWGETLPLVQHVTAGKMSVMQDEHGVQAFFHPEASPELKQAVLNTWYREQLSGCLPELISHWQVVIGVQVNAWGIKRMKTRWGSCNPRAQRIWLNLRLIHKPKVCLEYVLVHEMVHLLEASHNRRFYALMQQFLPEWKTCQNYL